MDLAGLFGLRSVVEVQERRTDDEETLFPFRAQLLPLADVQVALERRAAPAHVLEDLLGKLSPLLGGRHRYFAAVPAHHAIDVTRFGGEFLAFLALEVNSRMGTALGGLERHHPWLRRQGQGGAR